MLYPIIKSSNDYCFNINNINGKKYPNFSSIEKDSFESEIQNNIKLATVLGKDLSQDKKYIQLYKMLKKVNRTLIEKGYEPCQNFIINTSLADPFSVSNIGARYLQNLNRIVINPVTLDKLTPKEIEYLIVHEQAHYLHHNICKQNNKIFKPNKLAKEEKDIISEAFNKTLNHNGDSDIANIIESVHLANELEFVGYYFASRYFGYNFCEEVENIYKKYLGP